MPPPGRRRSPLGFLTALFALLLPLLSPAVLAQNAVLGLDIGTEYIKAALVKPGIPLDIVLTKDSKRKETSALAFKTTPGSPQSDDQLPERLYGSDALALAPRIPGDVYPNLKHLIGGGQPGSDEGVHAYRERYPALDLFEHKENGTLAFRSKSFPTTHPAFSIEELLGMEIRSIRDNAEATAGSSVGSAVITVPPFYSVDERRSIEAAAQLAGLRVLGLVSDGMAVGLNYATSRTFGTVDDGEKPEYHLVYDMGAGSTTATLLKMQGKKVKDVGKYNKTIQEVSTLGVGWDRYLGGDALNDLIVSDMIEKFVDSSDAKKAGIQARTIRQHGRTMAKFWKEAERLRQVLSANTETSGFFESLYEDIDFRYKLSRSTFEEMSADFALRVAQPITDALESAGMKIEELTSVILHGGAVRTPFVQASLKSVTGGASDIKSNVNADEAAVFGAAFKAAGQSPSFRVKEIKDNDLAIFPVTLHWNSGGKNRKQQVFVPTSQTGAAKQMPFKMLDDFTFSFSQSLPLVGTESQVLEVKADNLTASVAKLINDHGCVRENISTVVSIRLEPSNGLPEVTRGSVTCEAMEAEKKGMMDGVKDMFGFGKKDQKPLNEGDDEEVLDPLPDSTSETTSKSTSKTSSSSSSTSASSSVAGKVKEPKPQVKKTYTIPLSFEIVKTGLLPPAGDTLQRIKDGLAAFDRSDKGRRLREELYNGLEGFTYKVRDLLMDAGFAGVSTETQRSEVQKLLTSTNEWLQSEGSSASIEAIKEKLQGLKGLVDPVSKRKEESSTRPEAIEELQKALKSADKLKGSISKSVASAAEVASKSSADLSSSAADASSSAADAAASATASAGATVSSVTEKLGDAASSVTESVGDAASSVAEGAAEAAASVTEGAADAAFSVSEAASEASEDPSAAYSSIMAKISALSSQNQYTDVDLTRLTSAFDSATDWLAEKVGAQGLLRESDEPAFSSSQIEEKTAAIKQIVEELKRKKNNFQSSRSSSSKKTSKTKSKSSKSKASSSAAMPSSTSVEAEASATGAAGHDEL